MVAIDTESTLPATDGRAPDAVEAEARAIFESAADAIFVVTGETFVYCNPETLRMFRCSHDQITGRSPGEFSPPTQPGGGSSAALASERMSAALAGPHQVFEWRHARLDGTEFDAEVSLSRIEWGGAPHIFAIVREITDRKVAEAALRESEDQLRKIFEQSPMAMAIVGLDGTIEQINRKAIDTFGYLPEDLPTMDAWWTLAYPDPAYRKVVMDTWMGLVAEALAENREIEGREYRVTCKDRTLKTMSILGVPVAGKVFVMFGDVTERTRAEERLRHLNTELERRVQERTSELERANVELGSFAYSASHELRAPIARMQGFSREIIQNVARGDLDSLAFCADRIDASCRAMRSVIDSLLLLTRLSRAEIAHERIDLSTMAAEIVLRLVDPAASRAPTVTIAPDLTLEGDRALWDICLQNLIENALKFSAKHPTPEIEVGARGAGPSRVYHVRDNGAGFDMAFAAKLFQPFCRLHGEAEFRGTGVGLAIAHRIVERHGGHLWAEAAPDRGATFFFTVGG